MTAPTFNQAAQQTGWTVGRVALQDGRRSLLFEDPVEVVAIDKPQDIENALRYISNGVNERGLYAAGFMTYEASAAYDLATHQPPVDALTLLWFGLYREWQ